MAERGASGRKNAEFAAAARALAVRLDAAVMEFDQRAQQREPDPKPTFRSRQRLVTLDEQVEDPRQHRRLDALALVSHPHHGLVALDAAT